MKLKAMHNKYIKKANTLILAVVLLSFVLAFYFYSLVPDQMASHWSSKGEVNGYMSKFWGLFLLPFILLGLYFIFIIIPKIDPLRENIEKFRKQYNILIFLILLFLFYVYLLTLFWNIGMIFNMNLVLSPAIGIFFYCIGSLIENIKMNWFIGIRTPWTLSSENVWRKTHKLGGRLFKISGIIILFGIFFKEYMVLFTMIPAIASSVYSIIYSYLEYRKEKYQKTP